MFEGRGPNELHLGVTPWLEDWAGTAESLAQQGELAEALGFDSLWLPESHFVGRSANPAPLIRLAAVAAKTTTLALGTTSLLLPVRHPIHVAEEVAVLDCLSHGRVILGVGRGFRPALFAAFEVPREEKRDRFEAALETICGAWRGEPVAWDRDPGGKETRPIHLAPLPVQKPHPPIWVAAFGPKAMTQAGRLGLPYLASPVEPLSLLEENYALHRKALPADVDDSAMPVPVMRTIFVSRQRRHLEAVRQVLAEQAASLAQSPLLSLRRSADAEVEERALVGEPEEVAEGIRRYRRRLGLTHLIARIHIPGVEPEVLVDSLTLLAEVRG